MSKAYRPGDVKIHAITLWSNDRSRSIDNMSRLVKNIRLYESITDPVMTAVFTIVDGIGLAESFPLIGEEYIELDLETPGMDEVHSYRFDIIDIKDRQQLIDGKSTVYNLYGISKEFRKNTKPGHEVFNNADPVETIQKLVDKLKSDKGLSTGEGTYARTDFDLTKLRPLEAIDKVRLLTRNVNEQSSAFCFFENKHGFNFYSVEQLFKNGKTKIGDRVFFFDSTANRSIYENNFRQILGMSMLNEASTIRGVTGGQLNARIKTFDMITGEVVDKEFKDAESSAGFIYADDDDAPLRSSSGQVEDGEEPAAYLLNFIDSSKNDPNIQEMILERSSYVHKLLQQLFKIEIYGDLGINAGDVIEVNLPGSSGLTEGNSEGDRRFNGNFLVTKLVNNISLAGPRASHTITCEIIKGNLKQ